MSALERLAKLPVIDALGWTLVHSLWQGLAIAVVLAVVLRAMRSRSAAARYVVAAVAMLLLPACAIATFGWLNHKAAPVDFRVTTPISLDGPIRHFPVALPPAEVPHKQSIDQILQPMLPWLVALWIAGVILLGAYHLGGWVIVRRLSRSGDAIDDPRAVAVFSELIDRLSISRPVRFVRSALVQVPSVIGWLNPVVLLPINALTGLTSDQLRGLLAHELAHVRRYDYLANVIQTAIETLFFYHPAAWWIGRSIRQERENACDDLAAAVCDRTTYAQALAAMESLRASPAPALGARGGALLPRIRRILGVPATSRRRSIWSALIAFSLLLSLAVPTMIACRDTHAGDAKPTTQAVRPGDPPPATAPPIAFDLNQRKVTLQLKKNHIQDQIAKLQKDLNDEGVTLGPSLSPRQLEMSAQRDQLEKLNTEYDDAKARLDVLRKKLERGEDPAALEQALRDDPRMKVPHSDDAEAELRARLREETKQKLEDQMQIAASKRDAVQDRLKQNQDALGELDYKFFQLMQQKDQQKDVEEQLAAVDAQIQNAEIDTRRGASAAQSAAQSITPADLVAEKSDYKIAPDDQVSVSVFDLTAIGVDTKREGSVGQSGAISVPMIGDVKIAGKTIAEAERAIQKAYENAGLLKNANVIVTVQETRSRIFTVVFTRASAGIAGQYIIKSNDFRVLDALATAKAELAQIVEVNVRRNDGAASRLLHVPGEALLTGDPKYNLVIRPKDTIIVQTIDPVQPSAAPTEPTASTPSKQIEKLQFDLMTEELALLEAKQKFGANHPQVMATQKRVDNLKAMLAQIQGQSEDEETKVPTDEQIQNKRWEMMEQILLSAEHEAKLHGENSPKFIALKQEYERLNKLQEGSKTAAAPADNAAAHFVRLVVGKDRMTFEGQPITWDALKPPLEKVPDRANTALELSLGSEEVTVGQVNKARGVCFSLVDELKFKYLTETGIHPLGTKGGDETPTTAPTTKPAALGSTRMGEYYMGGHVKRTGVYSLSGREIRLTQAFYAAGGFDNPNMGDDTWILLRRKGDEGKAIFTRLQFGTLKTADKDPVLQADDQIEVGTLSPEAVANVDKAADLWKRAKEAEQQSDFPQAVGLYEEMKQLDPTVLHDYPNLESRLKNARDQIHQ